MASASEILFRVSFSSSRRKMAPATAAWRQISAHCRKSSSGDGPKKRSNNDDHQEEEEEEDTEKEEEENTIDEEDGEEDEEEGDPSIFKTISI